MRHAARAAALAALLAGPAAGQSAGALAAAERARGTAAGPWNGNWSLLRDDPRIRTRAGAATLRLHVIQDAAGPVELQWTADRGICEDPNAAPCEWVSARGRGLAVAAGPGALAVLLRISADPDDPFLLVLERSAEGRATARLVSEKGGIAYRLDAERE
ncbi:hypothetical protein [Roseomonas fluvialis]|uniref:Alkaline proteinase inhibitor/ Outer membrane lipoprotein Omp19 domain-containing protein n=1 Tax=Roseomonas fluvialis TaxID=1750527 RepID=A0ABN6NXE2_9PROT|nr:hypothetical protein [Roseomonas fluvialis]BDG71098.1 hypothetical protein Rmf_10270 [Roseomonas fluvialis]